MSGQWVLNDAFALNYNRLWIIVFTATFAWLIGRTVDRAPQVPPRRFALGLAQVAAFTVGQSGANPPWKDQVAWQDAP